MLKYNAKSGLLDEVYDEQGAIRSHWTYLLDSLHLLGANALTDKFAKSQRILRDDGATYNIYSDFGESADTWSLDLIPALITSEEWGRIEAGLIERSELFNLLLKDIYGPRDLIRQGIIPARALFSHPGFLRPCQGVQIPGEQQLILHGVDMVRNASGEMVVLTDRTQAPSGAGYALENRTVMSRIFPSLYRDSHVHRLASFFHRLRAKLASLSPSQDQPRIVVLTPGPHNETYFEHAFLANYLGFHLVQNGDLVVRNGYVWMKSLDGLNRVDVILRRVDDWYCDPVELRGDSLLGVASLLEVARAGRVVIANPLGSSVLENPVFLKYLPQISKALLGRELRLKTVPTHWCGVKEDLDYVLEHFDELVIKPIHRNSNLRSVYPGQLAELERNELLKSLHSKPHWFVAQPIMGGSHLPTFHSERGLVPRPSILRSFTAASDTSYTVLPGGLTRVGVEESDLFISNQVGSLSKDTWIIASEPERIPPPQPTAQTEGAIHLANSTSLTSRVVENLFWMGRYAERAESSLRLLRTVFMMINAEDPVSETSKHRLLKTVTRVTSTYPGFIKCDPKLLQSPYEELLAVVVDTERTGSIATNLNAMLYCADESKDMVSSDMFRIINDIRDNLTDLRQSLSSGMMTAPEEALDPLVTALMALAGLAQESMVRGMGWRFMEIGRRLERAIQTNSMLDSLLSECEDLQEESTLITALLLCVENLINYRRRFTANLRVEPCLDLVMLDSNNPRSLIFQLEQLTKQLGLLPRATNGSHELSSEERAATEAQTLVKLSSLQSLSTIEENCRPHLQENLTKVNALLETVSKLISDKYFDHRESSQQLVRSFFGS